MVAALTGNRSPTDEPRPYYVLASTGPGPWPHPVEVTVHPDGLDTRLTFSIGPHAGNVGGELGLDGVLDGEWADLDPGFSEEFDAADLRWLVPYLVRLAAGEDAFPEVVDEYVRRHGRQPDVRLQGRHGP